MEHICCLTQLRSLNLSYSGFTGIGAAFLSGMTCLTHLRVRLCDGMTPESLVHLKHLPLVYLGTDIPVKEVALIDSRLSLAAFRSNRSFKLM